MNYAVVEQPLHNVRFLMSINVLTGLTFSFETHAHRRFLVFKNVIRGAPVVYEHRSVGQRESLRLSPHRRFWF